MPTQTRVSAKVVLQCRISAALAPGRYREKDAPPQKQISAAPVAAKHA
jgi:hypothetical protein